MIFLYRLLAVTPPTPDFWTIVATSLSQGAAGLGLSAMVGFIIWGILRGKLEWHTRGEEKLARQKEYYEKRIVDIQEAHKLEVDNLKESHSRERDQYMDATSTWQKVAERSDTRADVLQDKLSTYVNTVGASTLQALRSIQQAPKGEVTV